MVWWVFRKIDITEVIEQILQANYGWVLLSLVLGVVSHIFRALRWNILIGSLGYKTKTHTTFYALMIGYMANVLVPRLGEISRCGVLHRKEKIPFDSLLGTVLSERVFDLIVLIVIIFSVITFQLEVVGGFVNRLIFEPLFNGVSNNFTAFLYLGLILFGSILILYIVFRLLKPRLEGFGIYQKIEKFVKGFGDGVKTILRLKKRTLFFFYTFMIWFMYFLMTYVVFFSMDATSHLTIIDGITILAIGSLGMVAPVPGGIGSYHFVVKGLLFELYGVAETVAGSWAVLIHTSQTLMILTVGLFSYFMIISLRKKENRNIESV